MEYLSEKQGINREMASLTGKLVRYGEQLSIAKAFEAQVRRSPTAVAVVYQGIPLTYRELNDRANRLAHYLRSLGVDTEMPVVVCLERSLEMIVSLLAVLKAGGAYVPLDPGYPLARLEYMLGDSGAQVLLTEQRLEHLLPHSELQVVSLDRESKNIERQKCTNPSVAVNGGHLAYVMYTSGSTGRPKGVEVEQHSVVSLVKNNNYVSLGPEEVMLQLAPASFDAATFEIWGALLNGGRLVIAPSGTLSPVEVGAIVREQKITTLWLTAGLFHAVVDESLQDLQGVRQLLAGGDVLLPGHVCRAAGALRSGVIINGYGPTENTTFTCTYQVKDIDNAHRTVPIGRPLLNVQVYILDQNLERLPQGEVGELYVAGEGLARGYQKRPDLTAEKFVPSPFSDLPGARLYQTGDLARATPDGNLEFAGRIDEQVKIRGYRIEPAEIEAALNECALVRAAAVVARQDKPGVKRLIGYVVPATAHPLTSKELRDDLGERLPEYMIPVQFVFLEQLPSTPTGKVDRNALPEPQTAETDSAPSSPTDELLANICGRILSLDPVPLNATFMELGGSSLNATRAISMIRDAVSFELPIRELLGGKTLREIARELETAPIHSFQEGGGFRKLHTDNGQLPASYSQERVWFVHRIDPTTLAYHFTAKVTFLGDLNVIALEKALSTIVDRHTIYRTTLVAIDGILFQRIHEAWKVELEVVDAGTQIEKLEQVIAEESRRPFELGRLPLVRWKIVRVSSREHVLVSVEHHILHDGWSFNVFLKELTELYRSYVENYVPSISVSPMQFADFAQWQREWMESQEARQQLAYWKDVLDGAPPTLLLPHDRPRPPVQTYKGDIPRIEISELLDTQLAAQCRSSQSTMFMLFAVAFQILLFRYSGQRDFCIGTGIANRRWSETRDLIGMLVNNIALRLKTPGDPTASEVLERIRKTTLEAYAHQDVPFDKVVQIVDPARDLRHNPIFQVLLSFHDSPVECTCLPGMSLEVEVGLNNGSAKFDMNIIVIPARQGNPGANYGPRTKILWEYSSDLFDAATIQQMMRHYLRVLREIAHNPERKISDIEMLTDDERRQVLVEFNRTAQAYPREKSVHGLFEEQARKTPQAVAVAYGGRQLTYAELDRNADQLAGNLKRIGMPTESRVGICIERGLEMVTGMLAILKAGGAYVPLDPAYPLERLQFMIEDAGIHVVLTQQALCIRLQESGATLVCLDGMEEQARIRRGMADKTRGGVKGANLAYVMYTSGSTGAPKGIEVEHRNIVRLVRNTDYCKLGKHDRIAQAATASFDAATFEIWSALLNGGRVVVIDKEAILDPRALGKIIESQQINTMFLTTALFNQVAQEESGTFAGLKYLMIGGEAIDPRSVRKVVQNGASKQFIHVYGPTEATTFSTWFKIMAVTDDAATIPIGAPIANAQAYVLDEYQQPVPLGVMGELYLGGEGIARGYQGRPELTSERFVPDPFSLAPGGRLYRTGDMVRRLRDGNLEFIGRLDEQVKIRGFRIELGEVESVVRSHSTVQEATVVTLDDQRRGKQLVAYVVVRSGISREEEGLRRYLREKLPEYMIPWIVWLESLPLTLNGKIDRKRLPQPQWDREEENQRAAPPCSQTQELLAAIWAAVLRVGRVNVDDDFFDLGGHSLLLMQVLSRIRDLFGVDVPVRDVFEFRDVAGLAARIDELMRMRNQCSVPPVVSVNRGRALPLSFAQQRLWFIQQFDPGSSVYNIPVALRLHGPLNVTALERSLFEITNRHEVLRSTFMTEAGTPVQVIHPAHDVQLPVIDCQTLPAEEKEATIRRTVQECAHLPFDLVRGPLLRVLLLQLDAEEYVFVLCMHHIISDGWSLDVLSRELATLYTAYDHGRTPSLPELPVQYADYAIWQRDWLRGEVLENQLRYWKQQLAGIPDLLELPMARPRPAVQSHQGAFYHFHLSSETANRLKEMAWGRGVTLFMTLLSAFYILLYRLTGQSDLVVGTPLAGRNRSETEHLIGIFVNTLVLRTGLTPTPDLEGLLKRVRETALGAFCNSDMPFEKLVEELQPERELSRTPLIQVTFALQNVPAKWALAGLRIDQETIELLDVKFDFSMTMAETEQGLMGYVGYRTDMFDKSAIERITRHFDQILQRLPENLGIPITELDLLTLEERKQILNAFNATDVAFPGNKMLQELFEDQVMSSPEAPAVMFEGRQLTYTDLCQRASHLAQYLQIRGVGPEVLVGICLERSLEMVVAIFGVLKAGGAYMPMAPEYPKKRLEHMVRLSKVKLVLTSAAIEEKIGQLPAEHVRIEDLQPGKFSEESVGQSRVENENPAYVIFTSGSTGEPKGVVLTHSAIRNHMLWMQQELPLTHGDRVLQKTPFNFDASVWEFFAPLLVGGTLVMAEPGGHRDGEYLVRCLQQECITVLQLVPSQLRMLLHQKGIQQCHSLRRVYCGGEALGQDLVREFYEKLPWSRLYNLYGPAEATVDSTWSECDPEQEGGTSLIGTPIANAQAYVLDQEMMPVTIGVPGELFIGGAGLARGYLSRSVLTAERFVPDPFSQHSGERLYRTGDRVRFRPNGQLEFLGRIDNQVKIRGYRIELGEIEAMLAEHKSIKQCVVVMREDHLDDKQLVAYVIGRPEVELDLVALRGHLKERLPDYMAPLLVQVESLPLTPNGKIDLNRLPVPTRESHGHEAGMRTPTQELLAGIWAEVLGTRNVKIDDNFFSLGGHSLTAVRVISRIQEVFGTDISVRRLFECPEIATLAEVVDQSLSSRAPMQRPLLRRAERVGAPPLSFAQLRLWFLQQFEPASSAYNISVVLHLHGNLRPDVLERSITEIISRHESLRTTFGGDPANPEQVIDPAVAVSLPTVDFRGLDHVSKQREARSIIAKQSRAPFDLAQGPLFRLQLVQLESDDYLLLLTMHHIISDGWSLAIFIRELATLHADLCRGESHNLPSLPVQYVDYAIWQRECLQQGDVLNDQMSYWRKQLDGIPELLALPLDSPRPATPSHQGARHHFEIAEELLLGLKEAGRREGTTLFMILLGALQILLHRYCSSDDIPVGTPHAGRNHPAVERLIGFFVNTLVLRTDLSGNPNLGELLKRVREGALGAYANQVPFEKLVEELRPERDLSRTPLFQIMFTLQNLPEPEWVLPGINMTIEEIETEDVKFDLSVSLKELKNGLSGSIAYRTDLFNPKTIARMAGHFDCILRQIPERLSASISSLNLLTPAELGMILEEWNSTAVEYPREMTLHGLFEQQATRTPNAPALIFQNEEITFQELDRKANRLARYLIKLGVGPEARVGIFLERSPEMVIALLAVLKAGGAYVPLDPAYPPDRLGYMVEDAQATVVLTRGPLLTRLPEKTGQVICLDKEWARIAGEIDTSIETACLCENLAYVIYTSGSTGKPKGVAICHESAVTLMYWARDVFTPEMLSGVLASTSICFDLSIFEIFVPLSWGGAVVLVKNALELLNMAGADKVKLLNTVPSVMRELLQMKAVPPSVTTVALAGEPLPKALVEQIYEMDHVEQVFNLYGPSEDTTYSVYVCLGRDTKVVPIGKPIANTRVYVLDEEMKPVIVGATGELYIGGAGLARGYLNKPELTAERFVTDPLATETRPGQRLYRTGDQVRWRFDGNLEFLGRNDHQVKVRGFRIELGEIESVLDRYPGVKQSVVVAREDPSGQRKLVAYLVRNQEANSLDAAELKSHLRATLPEYMVPADFVELAELPTSPNGKLDRKLLSSMDGHVLRDRKAAEPDIRKCPRNNSELYVIRIFEEVLGVKGLIATHNFFEAGGHSLSALILAGRLSEAFNRQISVRDVFEHPTIEEMAAFARQEFAFTPPSCLIPINPRGSLRPLFFVHPGGGRVMGYLPLGRSLNQNRPFYGLQSLGLEEGQEAFSRVEDMAAAYIKEVRNVQPTGPYQIGGWCMGGTVAYEMAQQLLRAGETVSLLAILEDFAYSSPTTRPITDEELRQQEKLDLQKVIAKYFPPKFRISGSQLPPEFNLSYQEQLELALQKFKEERLLPQDETPGRYQRILHVAAVNRAAKRRYHLSPYPGRATLFRCRRSWHPDPAYGWRRLVQDLEVHVFDWQHNDFPLQQPAQLAEVLERSMDDGSAGIEAALRADSLSCGA